MSDGEVNPSHLWDCLPIYVMALGLPLSPGPSVLFQGRERVRREGRGNGPDAFLQPNLGRSGGVGGGPPAYLRAHRPVPSAKQGETSRVGEGLILVVEETEPDLFCRWKGKELLFFLFLESFMLCFSFHFGAYVF